MGIAFTVNGSVREVDVPEATTLLETLRNHLGLMGTRYGCGLEQCGACMVLVDGQPVYACTRETGTIAGRSVATIEGLGTPDRLHPLQQAFLEEAALQCGICTPGFLMSSKALLAQNPNPSEHDIRFWLSGNLCRCTGYDKIIRAVQKAAAEMRS